MPALGSLRRDATAPISRGIELPRRGRLRRRWAWRKARRPPWYL